MFRTLPARTIRAVLGTTLLIALAAPAGTTQATAAVSEGSAWSLVTADNEHGTGRGNYAYDVDPGDVITDALVVRNSGTEPLELSVYAADAFTTSEGILDLRLADDPKSDSGSWITAGADTVSIEPGQSAEVPFTITVPTDARPGDHPGGIVTSFLSAQAGETLAVDRRLGIRVHLRVSGELTPAVDIVDATAHFSPSWNPFDGGTFTVSYTLVNTGDTRITADDAVALAGPLGVGASALLPQATAEVLPGSSILVSRQVTGVAPLGWIIASLTVAPSAVGVGAELLDPVTVDVSTAAISWMLIGVLLVLLIAATTIVVVVLRRRGGPQPAPLD